MIEIDVKVIGPGLVVNGPVAIIYDALVKAGYEVDLVKFWCKIATDSSRASE